MISDSVKSIFFLKTNPPKLNKSVKRDSIRSQLYIEKPCNPTALTYQRVSAQASHITCPSPDVQSKHRSGALFHAYPRPLPSPGLCPEPAWLPGLFYGSPSPCWRPSTCRCLLEAGVSPGPPVGRPQRSDRPAACEITPLSCSHCAPDIQSQWLLQKRRGFWGAGWAKRQLPPAFIGTA